MTESFVRHVPMSVEDYLRFEEASPIRHEYVAGEVYAMTGTTTRHNRIAGNIYAYLRGAARGTRCRVYMESVKLRAARELFYYPDVMVACGSDEPILIVDNPSVIIEIVSPSTSSTDRREKLAAYRSMPSVEAYLVVEQNRRRVTRHWRDTEGNWGYSVVQDREVVPLPKPVGAELPLDAIYEDIVMPPLGVAERLEEEEWYG
jgi:Uma2 family endonuclease